MYRIWFERSLPPEFAPLLDGLAEPAGPSNATPNAPLAALPGAHAIIASGRIKYNGGLMDLAPTLRVISRTGIGVDNVDIAAATARGIAVCNAPDAPSISTAEFTLTLLLAAVKHLKLGETMLRQRPDLEVFNEYDGREVYGLRLGLVGLGRIGSLVAGYAHALGMQVSAYDPFVPAERAAQLEVELIPALDDLLRLADVVSLHLPLTAETRRLINAERLALMRPGAYLINSGRGGLVDEAALLAALESGHLRGAALDVMDPEPPDPRNPLLSRDDVIATPHIASATPASKRRLWQTAITQALQVLRGERPPHLVNPEVWPAE